MRLELMLPIPESINSLYVNQFRFDPKLRRRVPTGGRVLSKAGEKNKEQIQFHARQQMEGQNWDYEWTENKNNFMYLDVDVYFPRKGRDADNIFKILHDSLEGIVFEGDARVLPRVQRILFDKENPRVMVTLTPVEYVGVFDNKNDAEVFEDNCMSCSRYRKGRCSILLGSLAGEVLEEVEFDEDNVAECSEYRKRKS